MSLKNKNYKNLYIFIGKKGDKILLQTAVHASIMQGLMYAVARYQELKSPNYSLSVKMTHFLPSVLLIFCNLATMHMRSFFITEAQTMIWKHRQTGKLEFSTLYVRCSA